MTSPSEFFVGYHPKMPPSFARRARVFAFVFAVAVPLVLGLLAAAQAPVDEGRFEFGIATEFQGVLRAEPVPMLETTTDSGERVLYALVGAFKFSIPEEAREHDGKRVRFKGSLIERRNQRMIEMNDPDSIEVMGHAGNERAEFASLGEMTLHGEIVDTKCFFGVMRPATGKVHRGCAIRCLSGGVPPGFRVVDEQGHESVLLLAARAGESLDLDIQLAGVPVEITGDVETLGDFAILRVHRVKRL